MGFQKYIQLGELLVNFNEWFRVVLHSLGILQAFKGIFFHVNISMVKKPMFFSLQHIVVDFDIPK